MKLNLTNLKQSPGVRFPFDWSSDYTHIIHHGRSLPLCEPVKIEGEAFFRDGVVNLDYELWTEVQAECSRCLNGVCSPVHLRETIEFIEEPEGGLESALIEVFSFEHGTTELDLMPYLERLISSSIETKPLCSADCKGICTSCGHNLNESECACDLEKETDPRLEKLQELLK